MAGFFGLFNFNKDGPGVEKDAPPKPRILLYFELIARKFWNIARVNLMFVLFNLPSIAISFLILFFMFMNYIVDANGNINIDSRILYLGIPLMTFFTSIPVITVGPAQAGFTFIMRNFAREEHVFIWSDFKEVAKKNFKQSVIVSLIDIAIMFVIAFNMNFYVALNSHGIFYQIGNVVIIIALILYLMMHLYIYPMMVTFKFTIKQLYKNAFLFAMLKFFPNIGILAVSAFIIFITMMISPYASVLFFLFVDFGLIGFTTNFLVYPYLKKFIIDKYEEEQKQSEKNNTK